MRARWLTIFLDFPPGDFDAGVAFWRAVTGSGQSASRGAAQEFATLLPPSGDPWLRAQRVASGPGGCHLDLHVGPSARALDAATGEAVALGAGIRHREAGLVVADSPGGFPFCLVEWTGEARAPEPASSGAGLALADQLCLDAPPAAFARESQFWAALLGRSPARAVGGRPEFAYLGRAGGCVRLVVQRRDEAEPGARVTGHLDVVCGDLAAATRRHVAAGSLVRAELPWWTVLTDPAGRAYCLVAAGRSARAQLDAGAG
ncbi:MAG TPA: VOC family protein [Trebonia sp.]|nr:VOC family protein [Trebonia sp.]